MSIIELEVKNISIGKAEPTIELSRRISHIMYDGVMQNFADEGNPKWKPLAERTKKQRIRQGFGPGPILDRKRGRLGLKGGIIEAPTDERATVGTRKGIPYDLIHQVGGEIKMKSRGGSVKLRTTKSGKLKRQKNYKNLAVFGSKKHKLTTLRKFKMKAYSIIMPARPYLYFTKSMFIEIKAVAKKFWEG